MSATASAISAAVAAFVAVRNGRSSDFDSCLKAVQALGDAQRRIRDATGETNRTFEFNELFNLMEALAHLDNRWRISRVTKDVTRNFLIEVYALMQASDEGRDRLSQSITSDRTYLHLSKFAKKHKARIEALTQLYLGSAPPN